MLDELIETFEELKKSVFIIDRGTQGIITIRFENKHFYHLVGLHKTNINMFFPDYLKTKDKIYKYLKKNSKKFNKILENQIQDKDSVELRIKSFHKIIELLNDSDGLTLYSLKQKVAGSMYDGDYGLLRIYEDLYCLFGLKQEDINEEKNIVYCVPQSWMASRRVNKLIEAKMPIYMNKITKLPANTNIQDL